MDTIQFLDFNFYINNNFNNLARLLSQLKADHFFIVYDQTLPNIITEEVKFELTNLDTQNTFIGIRPEESSKSLSTLSTIVEECLNNNATKKSVIISLGGGVVGNIAGLAAGLLFRGIGLVHLPTTILAASDSCPSLKQAANFSKYKNTIGLYHKPEFVYVSTNTFKTLPERQVKSAYGEFIKNILSINSQNFTQLESIMSSNALSSQQYAQLVIMGIEDKFLVMDDDIYEKKNALRLEYGHTAGHAIEILMNNNLFHGECVALGLLIAGEISFLLNKLKIEDLDFHYQLFNKIHFASIPNLPEPKKVLHQIKKDNKRSSTDKHQSVNFVLLSEINTPLLNDDELPLSPVSYDIVEHAITNTYRKIL